MAFSCPRCEAVRVAHSTKGNNTYVLLSRSEPATGSRRQTSPGSLITLLRGHFVLPTRSMFVILNEVKNLDLHAIRSFAGAQDDKLRSCRAESASACPCSYAERVRHSAKGAHGNCRAECAVFAHSAKGNNTYVLLCRSEPATSPRKTNISWRSHYPATRALRPTYETTKCGFVILTEVKNFNQQAIRSFADAQDDIRWGSGRPIAKHTKLRFSLFYTRISALGMHLVGSRNKKTAAISCRFF